MIPLSQGELQQFQKTATASMMDTCTLLVYTSTVDEFGEPIATYTPGGSFRCGFDPTATRERNADEPGTDRVITDGRLRLPLTAQGVVKPADRIQLTHRYGVALVRPMLLDVIGEPLAGPSALVVNVQEVR
jgi:hypothetical protein